MEAPLSVNLQTELEILKSKSLQELRELCPYKSLTKDLIAIIMLDDYSQHDRHKKVTDLVLGLATNTVLPTSNPKITHSEISTSCDCNINKMANVTITGTPTFNSKSMSFTKWISLLETEFTVKNVTTEQAKLAWLQLKLGIDNLQLLPTVVSTNTYEQYKQIIQSKFPVEMSEQELLLQYGSYRVNLTKDGLKDRQTLTLKTFRDKPEATQVSEMCSKLMLAARTDLQRYVIESAKSLSLSQAVDQISKTVPDKFKPMSHDRCKFCNFSGHSEEQCQPQEEKNTENFQSHNLILDPSPAIDAGTLSPGEFDDAYLGTVNNIKEEIEFENELPVTNIELASSVCFINQAKVLLDVGANINVLNTSTAKKLQIFDATVKKKILSCGRKTITPKGTTVTKDIPYDLIMNIQTCGLLRISIDTASKNITINDPFKKEILQLYPETVVSESNPLGKCTITAPPLMFRDLEMPKLIRYGVPPPLISEPQKEIDEMINLDVCKLNYNTKYIVPFRVVNKSSKQLRICQDFRELNKKLYTDFYCSASFKELFMSMKSFSFASRIDLRKAYWQICLHPSDRDKLGFFLNRKVYSLNRLPFGLSSSPGIFQRLMDQILSNVPSLVYQDDILILAGNSREEHKNYALQAIQSLHSHGLVVNLEKSTFFNVQCIFLGYKVFPIGISPNPKLIQSLKDFHTPKTPYQLRAFRELFNFLSHNIPGSAKLSIHLNEFVGTLQKSRKEIPIPENVQKDILAMKDSMSRIATLGFPDFSKDFLLMCDSSNTGYGSILMQSHAPINESLNPKQLYPIAVHSRSWDALAHSATPTYYELKSICRSLTFFSPLIRYSRIHVFTDHKNLLRIIMVGSLPIYQKYIFNICNFNCVIKFIEGQNNPMADALSRSPLHGSQDTVNCISKNEEIDIDDLYQFFHVNTGHLSLIKVKESLMQAITKNHPKLRVARRILKQVASKISQCQVCKSNNVIPRKKDSDDEYKVTKPMELLCLDLSKYQNTNILCVVDRYSKYKFFFELKSTTGDQIVKVVKSKIVDVYGLPQRLRSDNARNLIEDL